MAKERLGANRKKKQARRTARTHTALRKTVGLFLVVALSLGLLGGLAVGARSHLPTAKSWIRTLSVLKVRTVKVVGAKMVSSDEAQKVAAVTAGMFLGDVDAKRVSEALKRLPWVKDVRINRDIFGTVSLRLTERTPIALVNLGDIYQMDTEGVVLEYTEALPAELPIVSGISDTVCNGIRSIRAHDMVRLRDFMAKARTADCALFAQITQYDFSDPPSVRIRLKGTSAMVRFDVAEGGARLNHLGQVIANLSDHMRNAVHTIDMRYANMAFVQVADTLANMRPDMGEGF